MVDFPAGGVWIGYIRPVLCDKSLIDAACIVLLDFCSTDFVLLAGFGLFLRRVGECWTMATNGVALAEDRAGITFGVELYVPWDAPEAGVDISLEGVVLQGRDVRCVLCAPR